MYPQVYENQNVVKGLIAYATRLKGELVRADRELSAKGADVEAIQRRRDYYAVTLALVEGVGTSLAPDVEWANLKSKVTLLEEYRTARGELRMEILRQLKASAGPISVNELHKRLINAMNLTFKTKKERTAHRAILVDALHDLRNGPPSLVECTREAVFGVFRQPEQQWFLKRLRPAAPASA